MYIQHLHRQLMYRNLHSINNDCCVLNKDVIRSICVLELFPSCYILTLIAIIHTQHTTKTCLQYKTLHFILTVTRYTLTCHFLHFCIIWHMIKFILIDRCIEMFFFFYHNSRHLSVSRHATLHFPACTSLFPACTSSGSVYFRLVPIAHRGRVLNLDNDWK